MNNDNRFSLFIGRWQCLHNGHMHIFNTELSKGNKILIAIRDVLPDQNNPFSSAQVHKMLSIAFDTEIEKGTVKIIVIPDIKSVNYGRGVGYEVNEIKVEKDIASISATRIRELINQNSEDWKPYVNPKLHDALPKLYKNAAFFSVSKKPFSFFSKSVIKAITYRMLGTSTTVGISFAITHQLNTSLTIGALEVLIKIGNYVLHEYIWRFFSNKK